MHYEVKQNHIEMRWFHNKEITTTYKFGSYKRALQFCLDEQIKEMTCVISDKIQRKIRPFKHFYTLDQFTKLCKKHPLHYTGLRYINRLDLNRYYFYLVGSYKLTKLRKH